MEIPRFRRALLKWFGSAKRPLPWRRTRDAYAIWVSEMMLQQTTVAAVIPYFERFMARFPTFAALAASEEDAVLSLWSGLGYYSRARNLRIGARTVVEFHRGAFPRDVATALTLKGVGPYTARAVTSMAYGTRAAVVDGNVRRVLSRLFAERLMTKTRAQAHADEVLAPQSPGSWNEAMMELGATICTPRNARCLICPVSSDCEGRDRPEYWSEGKPRKATVATFVAMALFERKGRILLRRNPVGGLMGGLLDLPHSGLPGTQSAPPGFDGKTGGEPILKFRHTITHHRIEVSLYRATLKRNAPSTVGSPYRVEDLPSLPLGGLTRKALRSLKLMAS